MRSRRVLMSLAVLLAGLCPRAANAQTPDAAQQAADALRTGRYAEAQAAYRTLVDAAVGTPEGAAHALPYAATFLAVGAYTDGLTAIEAYLRRAPEDPYLHHARGRLLAALGRYEEAEAAYDRAGRLPDFWRNDLERGLLGLDRGDRRAAFAHLAGIYRAYREGRIRTADALAVAARAAAALEEYRDANEAFRTAHRMDATQPLTLYWWAELFREKFNEADAERSYREALALNPAYADAYVGLARTARRFEAQEDLAQQALRHNPHHVGALSLLAELRILDGLYDEAEAVVTRALAVNPNSVDALAQLASIHYLRGDSAAFRDVEQRVLAQGRREAAFYLTLATNAERRFRYPDALTFSRQATLVDRSSARAHTQLGTALLRLGDLDEARRHLEIAYERDPFNLFAANSLTLLDERAAFATLTGEHVTLYLPADERDVLGPLMLEVAEAAYDSLVARYPYRPPGRIIVEAYDDTGDFGVRVAGVPHLGLLGVSFGDVVALNTPAAQGREGTYNWARTLWHELAHTMAIGTSAFHVPRWFTEGLAVYEERRAHPAWDRHLDLRLLQAFEQDRLLPLAEIDRGFTRPAFPGQVLLTYYHASRVIQHLVDVYGWAAITRTLQALAAGQSIDRALHTATGHAMSALDAAFRATLRQEQARLAPVLEGLPDPFRDEPPSPLEADEAVDNAWLRALREGHRALRQQDYTTAEARFEAALTLYPDYVEPGNAYEGLAAVYRARRQPDRLIDVLARFLDATPFGTEAARELATLYQDRGDRHAAAACLERSLHTDPYDLDTRRRLADLYEALGDTRRAVRERRAVLALDPVDRAAAYYDLARSLRLDRQPEAARRAVLQALEIAPGFREAQRLLLDLVEQRP